jgi:hypothetical protein
MIWVSATNAIQPAMTYQRLSIAKRAIVFMGPAPVLADAVGIRVSLSGPEGLSPLGFPLN